MRSAVMTLIFLAIAGTAAELCAQPGDWYSRGIIRQQTIDLIATREKRQSQDSYLSKISRLRILEKQRRFTQAPLVNRKQSGGPANVAVSDQDTIFHSVGPPFIPQQLAAHLATTPQERQYIQDVFSKCLNFYTEIAQQKGVPLHDVARALNYYVATNYLVYARGAGPSLEQMTATRKLIQANMAQDDDFRRMSDREKQGVYETLIVLAGFVDLGYGTAKQSRNEKLAEQFRELAKTNLETLLGAPAERIRFTNEGWLSTEPVR